MAASVIVLVINELDVFASECEGQPPILIDPHGEVTL